MAHRSMTTLSSLRSLGLAAERSQEGEEVGGEGALSLAQWQFKSG